MPSPFPGMNPYFEQPGEWRGIHSSILYLLLSQIAPRIKPAYFAKIEETLYVDRADGERHHAFAIADVGITRVPLRFTSKNGSAVAVANPVQARLPKLKKRTGKRLAIYNRADRKVVTIIEVLSPSNKNARQNHKPYLQKRAEILDSDVNLVEIDLLRSGRRMPLDDELTGPYSILVSRANERPDVQVWPFSLQDPIPQFPLPLSAKDVGPMVNLKAVIDRVYDEAELALTIYDEEPTPPFTIAVARWAKGILHGVGIR